MLINKDTKIYGSFSNNRGNNGCIYFNTRFQNDGINAIYKSFFSDDIKKSIEAVKTLNISGFAISMPFKIEIVDFLDEVDSYVTSIGSCNTVINSNGCLKGYNTDWIGVYNYFYVNPPSFLNILGNGGFSKAVQFACDKLNVKYQIITRQNWNIIPTLTSCVFNATPVDIKLNENFIDGRPFTNSGRKISELQAIEQYKLYTT